MRRYFQKIPCYQGLRDQFAYDCAHHHPVFANPTFPIRRQIGRFCGDSRPLNSRILVSVGVRAFWWRFLAPCLRIQKFRSRRPGSGANSGRICSRNSDFRANVIRDLRRRWSYSGLSPRGRRPSTTALTRLGAIAEVVVHQRAALVLITHRRSAGCAMATTTPTWMM